MIVDRYTKVVLTVIAIALLGPVLRPAFEPRLAAGGAVAPGMIEQSGKEAQERYQVVFKGYKEPRGLGNYEGEVPRAWGRLVGVAGRAMANGGYTVLVFEAPDGIIRAVSLGKVSAVLTRK